MTDYIELPADWRKQVHAVKNGARSVPQVAETVALIESWRSVSSPEGGEPTPADLSEMTCFCHGRCVGASCPCICHNTSTLTGVDRQIEIIKAHYQRRCENLTRARDDLQARLDAMPSSPAPNLGAGDSPTPMAGDRIALLRRAAEGRREYAATLPEDETNPALREQRAALLAQSSALESAAKIMEGDNEPLYGLLPSWRWTDEEVLAVVVADAAVDVINSGSVGGDSTDTGAEWEPQVGKVARFGSKVVEVVSVGPDYVSYSDSGHLVTELRRQFSDPSSSGVGEVATPPAEDSPTAEQKDRFECEHDINVAAACPQCHARDSAEHPEWNDAGPDLVAGAGLSHVDAATRSLVFEAFDASPGVSQEQMPDDKDSARWHGIATSDGPVS